MSENLIFIREKWKFNWETQDFDFRMTWTFQSEAIFRKIKQNEESQLLVRLLHTKASNQYY